VNQNKAKSRSSKNSNTNTNSNSNSGLSSTLNPPPPPSLSPTRTAGLILPLTTPEAWALLCTLNMFVNHTRNLIKLKRATAQTASASTSDPAIIRASTNSTDSDSNDYVTICTRSYRILFKRYMTHYTRCCYANTTNNNVNINVIMPDHITIHLSAADVSVVLRALGWITGLMDNDIRLAYPDNVSRYRKLCRDVYNRLLSLC
jgi:hypothetical protein